MRKTVLIVSLFFVTLALANPESRLPFSTVFKGRDKFDRIVAKAKEGNWAALPLGERTVTVGREMVGTRYKNYTLEIDNRIEAPSVNFLGLDCWTFFEISLGFARMLDEPQENWTPERLLHYIELDRYPRASPRDSGAVRDIHPCIGRRDIDPARCNAASAPASSSPPAR